MVDQHQDEGRPFNPPDRLQPGDLIVLGDQLSHLAGPVTSWLHSQSAPVFPRGYDPWACGPLRAEVWRPAPEDEAPHPLRRLNPAPQQLLCAVGYYLETAAQNQRLRVLGGIMVLFCCGPGDIVVYRFSLLPKQ